MPWTEVDKEVYSIATVTAPSGQIILPAHKDVVVGQTEQFLFQGKNTNPAVKTLNLVVFVRDPAGNMIASDAKTQSLSPNTTVSLSLSVEFTMAGVYTATVTLFVAY